MLDTPTPEGFGNALAFLNNFYNVNQSAYALQDNDIAVVLIARHLSTLFAYNDAIWGKYGAPITQRTSFKDPKTNQPPTVNLFNAAGYGAALPNRGGTEGHLIYQRPSRRGVRCRRGDATESRWPRRHAR